MRKVFEVGRIVGPLLRVENFLEGYVSNKLQKLNSPFREATTPRLFEWQILHPSFSVYDRRGDRILSSHRESERKDSAVPHCLTASWYLNLSLSCLIWQSGLARVASVISIISLSYHSCRAAGRVCTDRMVRSNYLLSGISMPDVVAWHRALSETSFWVILYSHRLTMYNHHMYMWGH